MHESQRPFLIAEALAANVLSERTLRALNEPVFPGVYAPTGVALTAQQRAYAAWLWSRRRGVVSGLSAAALLGSKWINGEEPAELIYTNRHVPKLIRVHEDTLRESEFAEVGGIAVTTPARTAFDIGRRTTRLVAVQRLDALVNATGVKTACIASVASRHPGERGIRRLRRVLPLIDGGAESPQESRTRLMLMDAGFPVPETQIVVSDSRGFFIARLDMGWSQWRVGVEYDGAQHWTDPGQRSRDVDRLAELDECGWIIVRVTSDLLARRPGVLLNRVAAALSSRGWVR